MSFKQLRKFQKNELLFDESETIIILKFIFKPSDHSLIESLPMNDQLRGFAQGLLLEAIDASYAVGFIHAIFESTTNPTQGARKIILTFGKKAAIHWFKHASVNDKQKVKIYGFVRDNLARSFKVVLANFIAKIHVKEPFSARIAYNVPTQLPLEVLG